MGHLIHDNIWQWCPGLFCGTSHFPLCWLQTFQVQFQQLFSFNGSGWNVRVFIYYSSNSQISFISSCGSFSSFNVSFLQCGHRTAYCILNVNSSVSSTMPFLMTPHFCCSLRLKNQSGPACSMNKMIVSDHPPFLGLDDSQSFFRFGGISKSGVLAHGLVLSIMSYVTL